MARRESQRPSKTKYALGSIISIGRGEYADYMERQKVSKRYVYVFHGFKVAYSHHMISDTRLVLVDS